MQQHDRFYLSYLVTTSIFLTLMALTKCFLISKAIKWWVTPPLVKPELSSDVTDIHILYE
jgi:hypothetical protein